MFDAELQRSVNINCSVIVPGISDGSGQIKLRNVDKKNLSCLSVRLRF